VIGFIHADSFLFLFFFLVNPVKINKIDSNHLISDDSCVIVSLGIIFYSSLNRVKF